MFSKTIARSEAFTSSMTYAQSPLIMVVPPGQEKSSFSKLLNTFDAFVWQLFGMIIIFIIVFILILKCQRRRIQDFIFGRRNRTPLLNVMNVIVGLPFPNGPSRNFSRWILMMFILMLLVLRSLYQSSLYKDLQSTERNLPVKSVEESLRLGFMYYMISPTQENIKYLPEVYDRRIVVSRKASFDLVKKFNDPSLKAAFLAALDTVLHSNKINLYGIRLNICEEALMQRQYGIFFPKGSFLDSSFNDKLIMLMETGLIDHWRSQHTEGLQDFQPHPVEPKKLTLNHLLGAYQILLCGVSLASFIMLMELVSIKTKCLAKFFEFLT